MARASLSQVCGWDPTAADRASAAVVEADSAFAATQTRVARAVDTAMAGWLGAAATAAAVRALSSQLAANHIGAALSEVADAFAEAGALDRVCALVGHIRDEAHDSGCRIAEDGTVTGPHSQIGDLALDFIFQAGFDATALALQARLVPLLDTAGEIDERVGARLATAAMALAELRADPSGGGPSTRISGFLDGTALLPEDPKALGALWKSLGPADRDELFAADPLIGSRDGLPALARDHYNRVVLRKLRAVAVAEDRRLIDRHPDWYRGRNLPTSSGDWTRLRAWEAARAEALTRVAGYEALEQQLGPVLGGRLLLAVDTAGHGAIALNNPDTAANVATFVPGTGSPLTAIGVGVRRVRALLGAAERSDPAARTSVIAWYGYDAPPDLAGALGDRRADAGALALDRFESGLRASHLGLASHQTVLGHSYGSTVIGAAASGANTLAADDVVLVGSPGIEVDNVSELRLMGIPAGHNSGHVYATADPADPVPVFGQLVHGVNPVDREFRATVFTSSGATLDLPVLRALPFDVFSHGNYWEPGNPGLRTQGDVIAGRYRQ
ncbi:alpha/beta hydrolase [Nocardia sp. NPDC059764]|uniref:alpha/beta hydrolase n=1 Tax=Nocardia sp. NPDC059764 TaxID=3346939 RepID=UPI00365BE674